MGMESVYKLSVVLNLIDNLSGQMGKVGDSVSGNINKLNLAFGAMQKAGAAMAGAGAGIAGLCMKAATATFDTQNALGELSSLGVKDLKAVEDAAKSFSDTWAGTSKADFITASYDIKSGIASLTDEGVAQFTQLAALTGKATKSTTEEMGSLFATGYGIYKGFYDDMSDLEFGEMFSSGIATAVKNYKTSGSEMASAISALGATATNANVPLEEQLAILGQLQTTMSGSEAATKYKSFLNQASSAGEKLGLAFLDSNNQLLSMPEILAELKGRYGDTIDAVEKRELKEAFGTDEAVALIDLLYNNVEVLDSGIQDLQASMKDGISVTEEMAEAINNTPEQKFQVLKQQIHNSVEELGSGLLPAVNNTLDKVSGLIRKGSEWISNNQQTVQTVMNIALKLGVFLVIAGSVLGIIGRMGKLFLSAKTAIGLVRTAVLGMNTAFLASPITWVIAGIVALIAVFAVLWNKSEAFRNFWTGLFKQVSSAFQQAWQAAKPVLENIGRKFIELYQALQPVFEVFGVIFGVILTAALGQLVGCIQGLLAALAPLADALASLASFVTNVVNMIVALLKGDFSGAFEFAAAAAGDLKNFIFSCFDAMLSFLGGFADGFWSVVDGAFSAMGIDASGTMARIRDTVKNGLGAASDTVKEKLGNMKAAFEEHGGGIKGMAAAAIEGVKGSYAAGFAFIDSLTGGKLTDVRDKFREKMASAKDTVASALDGIKSAFASKLEAARSAVDRAIGKIKGIFKFSWKLPDLKLPHISVSGGKAPFGIAGKGSLPSFDIQWYKDGGILTGPTIFGSMGGSLLGGGEAGAEAVVPLSELWKRIAEIVKDVIGGDDEGGDRVQQTGADITSALASKAISVRKEKESSTTTKKTYTTERWGKEKGITINHLSISPNIDKLKDLPLLFKLIDELKDAQNRTDNPDPEGV